MNPRPVWPLKLSHCGPVEKEIERSICLSLVVAARQSFPEKSFVSFMTYLLIDFKITCVASNSLPHTIIQRYFSVSTF